MHNFSLSKYLSGLKDENLTRLWLPVIEIYSELLFDGKMRLSAQKAVWIESAPEIFERFDWDANIGDLIDDSLAFYGPPMSAASRQIIKQLPKPYLKAFSAQYLPYTATDWQIICGQIKQLDELLFGLEWLSLLSAEERYYFNEALSQGEKQR